MDIKLVSEIVVSKFVKNYDYKKYEVTNKNRKAFIYELELNNSFITLNTNQFYDNMEDAAQAAL